MLIAFRCAQVAEKELQACLAEKDPTLRNIDQLIAQYLLYFPESTSTDFLGTVPNARTSSCKTLNLLEARAPKIGFGMHMLELTTAFASSSVSYVSSNSPSRYNEAERFGLSFARPGVREG